MRNRYGVNMKSFYPKGNGVEKSWYVIDLKDKTLGRAATKIATILRGKHKPVFTPSTDTGDFIVAINAKQIRLTGNKMANKIYYKHTGHMGGLKQTTAKELMAKDATALITKAVKGMLPRGPLGRKQLKKLKVYTGSDHPHTAQKPKELRI